MMLALRGEQLLHLLWFGECTTMKTVMGGEIRTQRTVDDENLSCTSNGYQQIRLGYLLDASTYECFLQPCRLAHCLVDRSPKEHASCKLRSHLGAKKARTFARTSN